MKTKWMMMAMVMATTTTTCAYAEDKPVTHPPAITQAELPRLEAECKKLSETSGKPHQLVTGKVWSASILRPNSIIDCFGDAACKKQNLPDVSIRYDILLTDTNVSTSNKRIGISTGFISNETIPSIRVVNNKYYGICVATQTEQESAQSLFVLEPEHFTLIRQLEK